MKLFEAKVRMSGVIETVAIHAVDRNAAYRQGKSLYGDDMVVPPSEVK